MMWDENRNRITIALSLGRVPWSSGCEIIGAEREKLRHVVLFSAGPFVFLNICQWLLLVVPLHLVLDDLWLHEDATPK